MVGVDVDERGVEADRPLEERDQRADRPGVDAVHGDGQALAVVVGERLASAEQEPVQVVAGRDPGLDFDTVAAVFQDADERREEVVDAVAELLHVGMLISRALVAEDVDPLIDALAVQVEPLAERFHHKLLKVAAEQEQPVLIRKDDHVLHPLAAGGVIPHQREQGGRVLPGVVHSGRHVAGGRAGEQRVDLDPLERGGKEADGRKLARPTTDPVPHREPGEPTTHLGGLVQGRANPGDGDGVPGEIQPGGLVGGGGGEHAVARLGRAAALADDHAQGRAELVAQSSELTREAVGIGVVEKVDGQLVGGRAAEGVGDELRAER